jgi:hypothetical protein
MFIVVLGDDFRRLPVKPLAIEYLWHARPSTMETLEASPWISLVLNSLS